MDLLGLEKSPQSNKQKSEVHLDLFNMDVPKKQTEKSEQSKKEDPFDIFL